MQIRRLGFVELPDHHHVEQGVAAQVARSAHRSHQRFEWAVLIYDRVEAGGTGGGEEVHVGDRGEGIAQVVRRGLPGVAIVAGRGPVEPGRAHRGERGRRGEREQQGERAQGNEMAQVEAHGGLLS